jgi:hypothetical protein
VNPFEFIIILLVLVLGYKLFSTYAHKKEEHRDAGAQVTDDLRKELARLDKRIQVLERIVTDGRYDLDRELKDLGD